MFMTRSFNVTPKTTEQHLIACSDKSVAYVTNNNSIAALLICLATQCYINFSSIV